MMSSSTMSSCIDCMYVNGLFITAVATRFGVDMMIAETGECIQHLREAGCASSVSFSYQTKHLAVVVLPETSVQHQHSSSQEMETYECIYIYTLIESASSRIPQWNMTKRLSIISPEKFYLSSSLEYIIRFRYPYIVRLSNDNIEAHHCDDDTICIPKTSHKCVPLCVDMSCNGSFLAVCYKKSCRLDFYLVQEPLDVTLITFKDNDCYQVINQNPCIYTLT